MPAKLVLETKSPRVGAPLQGCFALEGEPPARAHGVAVECWRRVRGGNFKDHEYPFKAELKVEAQQRGGRWVLPFHIDLPVAAPPSDGEEGGAYRYRWRLGYFRAGGVPAYHWTEIAIAPADAAQLAALEASYTPEQKIGIRGVEYQFGRDLLPHERAIVAAMAPEERAALDANGGVIESPRAPVANGPFPVVPFVVTVAVLLLAMFLLAR